MLGYLIVGKLAQSELYVKRKLKACDEVGINHRGFHLPLTVDELELQKCV
jgi:5,10-methylene-tetrahydrofolate dehydrogenase/methenyl tetrahydrofolate cyclohydrolase